MAELLETKDVDIDNDDAIETEEEPVYYYPDRNELLQVIKTMLKFSLFSKDCKIVMRIMLLA